MKSHNKIFSLLTALILMVFITSCGPSVTTTKKANVDLNDYNSFAWLPSKKQIDNENYNTDLVYSTIVNEVNQELNAEGYRIDKRNPDLLVKVNVMFDRESSTVTEPVYATYDYVYPYTYVDPFYEPYYYTSYANIPRVIGYDVDQVQYTEGTFVIDIIDAKTNNIVWRGWTNDRIQPSDLKNEINNYVQEIFEEFPS